MIMIQIHISCFQAARASAFTARLPHWQIWQAASEGPPESAAQRLHHHSPSQHWQPPAGGFRLALSLSLPAFAADTAAPVAALGPGRLPVALPGHAAG